MGKSISIIIIQKLLSEYLKSKYSTAEFTDQINLNIKENKELMISKREHDLIVKENKKDIRKFKNLLNKTQTTTPDRLIKKIKELKKEKNNLNAKLRYYKNKVKSNDETE